MGRSIGEMLALCLRLRLDGYRGLGGELALRTLTLRSEATNCTLIPRPRSCCAVSVAVAVSGCQWSGQKVLRIKQDQKWCHCFLSIWLLNLAPAPPILVEKIKKGLKAA